MNMWKNGFTVLLEMFQFEGYRLMRRHSISVSEFKVSCGWVRCFMARYDLTIRHQVMSTETTGIIEGKAGQFS
jgi:hypothetical protein